MRNFLLISLSTLVIAACGTKSNTEMEVIRDCTGTYLRNNDKDYHVCNVTTLEDKSEGEMVVVSYTHLEQCTEGPDIVCELYHKNEGWIEVTAVK